jgi:hypothetical protein
MTRHILPALLIAALVASAGCKGEPKASCGDGRKHSSEVCDGTELGGMTCQDFGFLGGTLRCTATCDDYVYTYCAGGCGNNVAEGAAQGLDHEEPCDGTDVRGENCSTITGNELGLLGCLADCSDYDTGDCYDPTCGDDIIEGHEECEPGVPLTRDCVDEGFNEGELACTDCMLDTSGCISWECGNGVLEGLEQCDGTIFRDDEDCISLGHDGGDIACFGSDAVEPDIPCRFDESGCIDYVCGNDVIEGDEDCEPGLTFTETCVDEGFLSGDLACTAADDPDRPCLWDFSSCVGGCGNNIIEGISDGLTADELCDGTALDGNDCTTIGEGFSGGELACQPTCDAWDTTGCIT